ncbi:hypothetical protein Ciccas_014475, partial [Cichlidogyrus casuarinus]
MQSDDCGLSWNELQLVYEEFMITHQDRLRSAATTRAKFNARHVETGILLKSNSHPPRYFQPCLHSESVDEELRELAASLRRLLNHSADMPKQLASFAKPIYDFFGDVWAYNWLSSDRLNSTSAY